MGMGACQVQRCTSGSVRTWVSLCQLCRVVACSVSRLGKFGASRAGIRVRVDGGWRMGDDDDGMRLWGVCGQQNDQELF